MFFKKNVLLFISLLIVSFIASISHALKQSNLPSQPKDTLDLPKPMTSPISPELLVKLDKLMSKHSTWDKIPKKVKLCFFLPNGSRSELFKYAKDYMNNLPKFTDISEEAGISLDLKFISDTHLQLSLASKKLKRKAKTDIKFKIYTSESIVAEDFKAKRCDAAAMSNMRARQFNSFIGSLDALGALPDYKHLTTAIQLLAKPKLSKYMVNKNYEAISIMPAGAAYILVNDRKINDLAKAAGKKIAVLDFDKSQQKMVMNIGAQPVSADITTMGPMFNNGQVDIIAAPAVLFNPFELYKGLEKTDAKGHKHVKGGIINFPIMQLTLVTFMHKNRFPDGVGQLIREYSAHQLQPAYEFISKIEKDIPKRYWMNISAYDKPNYHKLMRESRIQMIKDGHYHPKMMRLLKHVRCQHQPANYECSLNDE